VAQVCLLGTETCVASMQKKSQYTTEQSTARDMGERLLGRMQRSHEEHVWAATFQ
jgi:hypothetical protein